MYGIHLTLLLCLLFPLSLMSQVHPDSLVYKNITWEMLEGRFYDLDVNGVEIHDSLTKEDFIEKFGVPTKYYNDDGRYDWPGESVERGCHYGKNYFETNGGEFWEFYIYDPEYKVMTRYFDGGVSVGDHISIFKGFTDGVLHQRDVERWGPGHYQLLNGSDGCYLNILTDDKGYIIGLYYVEPV